MIISLEGETYHAVIAFGKVDELNNNHHYDSTSNVKQTHRLMLPMRAAAPRIEL